VWWRLATISSALVLVISGAAITEAVRTGAWALAAFALGTGYWALVRCRALLTRQDALPKDDRSETGDP
jgi:uncharacterized membrane protein